MVSAADLMQKDFLAVEKDSSLSRVIGKMVSSKKSVAIVLDNYSFAGIVSIRSIAGKNISNPAEVKIGAFAQAVPVLEPEMQIEKIADLFFSANVRILPVVKNNSVLGVVSVVSVAKQIASIPEIKKMPLSAAVKEAVVLDGTATVNKALSSMLEKNVLGAAVIDKNSKLTGVVSLESIVKKFMLLPKEKYSGSRGKGGISSGARNPEKDSLTDIPVTAGMDENFVSISPDQNILKAANLMVSSDSCEILVEENSRVLGIVSAKNILPLLKTMGAEKNIQVSKMPDIDSIDKAEIMGFLDRAYEKISRMTSGEIALHVHFKEHGKGGSRTKHVVHLKLVTPKKTFVAEAVDWKLLNAVKNASAVLERETINFSKRE
ncbi:MAG: CBS domain-containing protein [Candidatus ainarchaeum sp.]|nr:CBS domain-containing protein [Candidatus ainarchaeum sp.]